MGHSTPGFFTLQTLLHKRAICIAEDAADWNYSPKYCIPHLPAYTLREHSAYREQIQVWMGALWSFVSWSVCFLAWSHHWVDWKGKHTPTTTMHSWNVILIFFYNTLTFSTFKCASKCKSFFTHTCSFFANLNIFFTQNSFAESAYSEQGINFKFDAHSVCTIQSGNWQDLHNAWVTVKGY